VRPGGEFTDKQTGEIIAYGARAQFEVEQEDGSVTLIPVRATELDKCTPPVDLAGFARGDKVQLRGHVVLQPRGSAAESFAVIESVLPA